MVNSIRKMKCEDANGKEMAKMALGLIFGLAADAAITAALGGLIPGGRGWKRMMRMAGTFIIGMMVGEKIDEYTCKVFEETDAALKDAKKELETAADGKEAEGPVK